MAERRMFAKTIIDSDLFLDMPMSAQLLYFHLAMRADDDGFINNPKKIQRMVGCSDDDIRILILKQFILPFESGIIVIKHWKVHNYIRSDRYKPTRFEEKNLVILDENMVYQVTTDCQPTGIPTVDKMDTQVRLGKVRSGKDKDNMSGKPDSVPSSPEPQKKKGLSENAEVFEKVVSYLNEKTGKNFKADAKKTQSLINSRLKEKFTVEDFFKVIDVKCIEWLNDPNMNKYLRPETLFGSKFESYLNQNVNIPERSDNYESIYRSSDPNDAPF